MQVLVSIILPMCNEASNIHKCLHEVSRAAEKITSNHEIIIAEDGSTDGTDQIAASLSRENTRIRHIHSKKKLGRGRALKNAFLKAKGDILVYMDADLATDLKHLSELINAIKRGADLSIGSRIMKGAYVKRSFLRETVSRMYNLLVRVLFNDGVHDHQCGFKAFSRRLVCTLANKVRDDGWFFDTEIIVQAVKMGYQVVELPVCWEEKRKRWRSKVNILKDSVLMAKNLINLFFANRSVKSY